MVGNGYLTSTWDHCTEEMNVNVGKRLSPACPQLVLDYSWSFFLLWLSASESARSLGCTSSSCCKKFWGQGRRIEGINLSCLCLPFFILHLPSAILFHNLTQDCSLLAILTIAVECRLFHLLLKVLLDSHTSHSALDIHNLSPSLLLPLFPWTHLLIIYYLLNTVL